MGVHRVLVSLLDFEFFQCIFQREMPGCALGVEACRIGSQKSKGCIVLLVMSVFSTPLLIHKVFYEVTLAVD